MECELIRRLLAITITLILLGCTQSSPESDAFFQKFAAALNAKQDGIPLSEVTDFPWEDVCLFKADGPYPYVGYESYRKHVTEKGLDGGLSSGKYGLILLFLDQGKVAREYFQSAGSLTINGEDRTIELASKKPFIKFCSTAEGLTFSLDKDSSAVLISKQRP